LNPALHLSVFNERLDEVNIEKIFRDYDLIVDGSDNFQTRYLVNDFAVKMGKPYVHGSVFRFEGQVSVFDPRTKDSPCYRCVYPVPPPPELAPSCQEAGVLGVLPGVIGLLESTEALKSLLGIGDTLVGRLLCYDALSGDFTSLRIRKNPDCECCVHGRSFSKDYAEAYSQCKTI
jgi:molybdopterin/thiamine biosynthesis adenylyltransferase